MEDYQEVIQEAIKRVADIAEEISRMSLEDLLEYYYITYADADGKILSVKIDECDYQLFFDIMKQADGTYKVLGEVEILDNSYFVGMIDKDLKYIPPE